MEQANFSAIIMFDLLLIKKIATYLLQLNETIFY